MAFYFAPPFFRTSAINWADVLILLAISAFMYFCYSLAFHAPNAHLAGVQVTLDLWALPGYALFSLLRMTAAYILALAFSLPYAFISVRRPRLGAILIPVLDVLQSVPILSFLPLVLIGTTSLLPGRLAAEIASILLIFTSQAWNLAYCFYQSLLLSPQELREAAAIMRLAGWRRALVLELPGAASTLIWNSMMSWAGGWFFLMAAESFKVGERDFRLPGLGSYLAEAALREDHSAIFAGILTLVVLIVLLEQIFWRPLSVWAFRFRSDLSNNQRIPHSWLLALISRSTLCKRFERKLLIPISERFNQIGAKSAGEIKAIDHVDPLKRSQLLFFIVCLCAILFWGSAGLRLLANLTLEDWQQVTISVLATSLRVLCALLVGALWTVPVGILIGSNIRLAAALQPLVQIAASIPASGFFPIIAFSLVACDPSLNISAVVLMLLGTQWYLLFNVIAGVQAIPQDLRQTAELLQLSRWQRFITLTMPALFPYLVTGSITAAGGAWNASIIAERVEFGHGITRETLGVGSLIAHATSSGDSVHVMAGSLALMLAVVLINSCLWRPLYRLAYERYSLS